MGSKILIFFKKINHVKHISLANYFKVIIFNSNYKVDEVKEAVDAVNDADKEAPDVDRDAVDVDKESFDEVNDEADAVKDTFDADRVQLTQQMT